MTILRGRAGFVRRTSRWWVGWIRGANVDPSFRCLVSQTFRWRFMYSFTVIIYKFYTSSFLLSTCQSLHILDLFNDRSSTATSLVPPTLQHHRWCERSDSCVYLGPIGSIDESWSRDVYAKQMDGSSLLDASRPACSLVKDGLGKFYMLMVVDGHTLVRSRYSMNITWITVFRPSQLVQVVENKHYFTSALKLDELVKVKRNVVDPDRLIFCSTWRFPILLVLDAFSI